jgi:hypothetical protein
MIIIKNKEIKTDKPILVLNAAPEPKDVHGVNKIKSQCDHT